MTFWDAKKLYFVEMNNRTLTPQQRANLRLLDSLLEKAFQAGFDEARKTTAADTRKGIDKKGFLM
jgi:hypothetical protein